MYCKTCGAEVSEKAVVCVTCGVPPLAGNKFCWNCKSETDPNATLCIKCGCNLTAKNIDSNVGERSWTTSLILVILLGGIGVHRFYTGYTGIGILQLLTCGGCGIWALIDLINIATGKFKDADGKLLKKE